MMINSVSAVSTITTQPISPKASEKRTTNPIEVKAPALNNDNGALKSYFLGGISFKGQNCSTSNFAIKKIEDVPCCCCGDLMLRKEDIYKHEQHLLAHKGDELAKTIKEEEKYFRTAERTAAFMIADAVKGTDMTFADGITASQKDLPQRFDKYCRGVLGETYVKSVEKAGYDAPISKFIQTTIKGIEDGDDFDRIGFTTMLQGMKGNLSAEDYGAIEDTAMNLPENRSAVMAIYKKYANAPEKFAHRLYSTAMTTAEHVHPHSLGGPNNTANYLAECAGCNNPRGNMSYAEWLKVHPEYPRKAQEHIEHVQARLINGEIGKDYNDYPVDVRGSLSKESGGRMVLKVLNPDTIENMRKARGLTGNVTVEDVKAAYEKQEAEKSEKA